ncbi:MAG TPA: hypothetical protein VG986_11420 [Pseudolabrys sp.]|nr:hypothetical protein [Pseudolabrys sp.]
MQIAEAYVKCQPDDLKAALAGGKLVIYSVARPASPDKPVERSGVLASFAFASPAFGDGAAEMSQALFANNPVVATGVGTPGFARAYASDGTTAIADFSAGAGDSEIKLSEVSTTPDYPVSLTRFKFALEG